MKRSNNFIPTLIAMTATCAAAQCVQAQAPARQAFPWSSAAVVESAKPAVAQTATALQNYGGSLAQTFDKSVTESFEGAVDSVTSIPSNTLSAGETVYLDENGNPITREQMQAKLTGVQNLGQSLQNRVPSLQPVDKSVWAKAKNMTSKATSFWKKPSLFQTPEGITLPSVKTTWSKPKFAEPTTWFSKRTTDPITFAPQNSLPRQGAIPTSIDGPLTSPPAQFASQNSGAAQFPSYPSDLNSFGGSSEATAESILYTPDYEVAESVDNSFDPRR